MLYVILDKCVRVGICAFIYSGRLTGDIVVQ